MRGGREGGSLFGAYESFDEASAWALDTLKWRPQIQFVVETLAGIASGRYHL